MSLVLKRPTGFQDKFERKPGADKEVTHYCPGCGHGRIHKLVAEAMQELEIRERTVFISPVGCSVFGYYYFNCGNVQAAHGRAPAVGTGISRSLPHSLTISYQGDGDLAAIGTAEIIHAANRGENMTVIFVNNGIYGMTGGQMAPTTLQGQKTTTSPYGREVTDTGHPIRMSEIIATLEAPVFVERVMVSDAKNIFKAKRAIQKAIKAQKDGLGFSFVEVLSTCPIGWKMRPVDAIKRLEEQMQVYFPVKNFKDVVATRPAKAARMPYSPEKIFEVIGLEERAPVIEVTPDFIKNFPIQKIRVAGFGGQGVLMAGSTLGLLAMEHNLFATWLPSYGPEMRGGTANCHVVLSNKSIGSPVVDHPNVLIAMNIPSLDTFEDLVEKNGLIIVNSSIINRKVKRQDIKAIYIPMTEIAESAGLRAASNMVAVATYLISTGVMTVENLIKLISVNFKKKDLVEQNIQIIRKTEEHLKLS
jgi:2-oxoisovalerate ferredoxin oxidoreductase beta subunit